MDEKQNDGAPTAAERGDQPCHKPLTLATDTVAIRPLRAEDAEDLVRWLSDERVLQWYGGRDAPLDRRGVEEQYLSLDDGTERYLISAESRSIGYLQCYEVSSPWRETYGYASTVRVWGLDLFLGEPSRWGRGLGRAVVRGVAEQLLASRSADRVVIDPRVDNERAIRCYEAAGFAKALVLRSHEWHEGAYRDCWLMEYRGDERMTDSLQELVSSHASTPGPITDGNVTPIEGLLGNELD